MSSIRSFVKKGERQSTSGMIGLFGLKLFEELAKLGREAELRQYLNEFLPEGRVAEEN